MRLRRRPPPPKGPLAPQADASDQGKPAARRVFTGGRFRRTPVLPRAAIAAGPAAGPLLVVDYGSTLLVPPGWTAAPAGAASLILRREVTG